MTPDTSNAFPLGVDQDKMVSKVIGLAVSQKLSRGMPKEQRSGESLLRLQELILTIIAYIHDRRINWLVSPR